MLPWPSSRAEQERSAIVRRVQQPPRNVGAAIGSRCRRSCRRGGFFVDRSPLVCQILGSRLFRVGARGRPVAAGMSLSGVARTTPPVVAAGIGPPLPSGRRPTAARHCRHSVPSRKMLLLLTIREVSTPFGVVSPAGARPASTARGSFATGGVRGLPRLIRAVMTARVA